MVRLGGWQRPVQLRRLARRRKLVDSPGSLAIAGLVDTGSERTSIMMRLRYGVMAVVLGTGMLGCSSSHFNIAHWSIYHCDECDDFPMPAYGPGFSMAPGTYTNVGGRPASEGNGPANSTPGPVELAPPGQPMPATPPATNAAPDTPTPPAPPVAAPGPGAARQPASTGIDTSTPVIAGTDPSLPPLPPEAGDLVVPRASLPDGSSLR